ncbi:MAG TPA: hypothetical protein PK156_33560 [Polyangium sp.]|nr:hypothetical protein [Polyangium sp.]
MPETNSAHRHIDRETIRNEQDRFIESRKGFYRAWADVAQGKPLRLP